MTREQANKIAKAVDDIDSFECFMDILDGAILQGIEICGINPNSSFINELHKLMDSELHSRKAILEDM